MQVVVIETAGRLVVLGGDVAVWFGELDDPQTEGRLRVRGLDPELVWLAHEHEPWRPFHALSQYDHDLNRRRKLRDLTDARNGLQGEDG
jgi:N-acyl homoserine lactone hydrolase